MLAIYLILILGALALLSGSIAGISLVIEVNRLKKRVEMLEKNGKTQEFQTSGTGTTKSSLNEILV